MNFTLRRASFTSDGIFGALFDEAGDIAFQTLEHSYGDVAKVAPGSYTCTRRHSPEFGYDLFIINGVPDFQGQPVSFIEIHIGNFNADSRGCILLGESVKGVMITESKKAFAAFMQIQDGLNEFTLTVT